MMSTLVLNFVNLFQSNGEIKGIDPMVYGLCTIMGLCNACTNPILYGYLNENFRREYRNLFRKLPWHSIIASNDNQATGNLKSGNLPKIYMGHQKLSKFDFPCQFSTFRILFIIFISLYQLQLYRKIFFVILIFSLILNTLFSLNDAHFLTTRTEVLCQFFSAKIGP